jgi:ATP-binding cassette subfamily B (MDR/TAP) protein 1
MFWLSSLKPTVRETDENRDHAPKSGGPVVLENVRFSYPSRPDAVVLRGVDLKVCYLHSILSRINTNL